MHILLTFLMAQFVTLSTSHEEFVFDIHPEDSFEEVIESAAPYLGDEDVVVLEVSRKRKTCKPWNRQLRSQGHYLGHPRNYEASLTHEEKSDIHFIVTTLADKSLITIAKSKTELENAGDRIDHIHPLNFLRTIFTDEKLKVDVRNIRGKGWVWQSFTAGLKDTLTAEWDIGNLKTEYIVDFARSVGLDPKSIAPLISSRNWDALIDTLINTVPRVDDGDRYDC